MIEGLVDDAVFTTSWTDNTGDPVQSAVAYYNSSTISTLEFDPLFSSHGGQYMCNASITIPAISTVKRSSEPHNVIIQGNA